MKVSNTTTSAEFDAMISACASKEELDRLVRDAVLTRGEAWIRLFDHSLGIREDALRDEAEKRAGA